MRKEIPYLHYVRVIACFMVVMLHASPHPQPYTIDYYFTVLIQFFTRPCVPLFFMVSGVLLLPYKDISIKHFYSKRLKRIFFPLIFWGIVYAVLPYMLGMENKVEMLNHLLMVPLTYPPQIGGILWFMYIILGIYMIIPFINPSVFDNKRMMRIYIGLWILSTVIMIIQCYHHQLLGMTPFCDINMLVYFSGYLGYLFLGKYIHRYSDNIKHPKIILFLLPLIYICGMILIVLLRNPTTSLVVVGFLTLPAIVMSATLFLMIKLLVKEGKPWCYALFKNVSKLSYGIYLSHMTIYSVIINNLWGGGIPDMETSIVHDSNFFGCIYSNTTHLQDSL